MFERFTDRARRVLVLAQEEARRLGHDFIGTEHILLGLVHEEEGVAAAALRDSGVTIAAARARVKEVLARHAGATGASPPFTPRAKKVLELSLREALAHQHSYIGTEHILLGTLREGEGMATHVLVELGVNLEGLRQRVEQLMEGGDPEPPVGPPRSAFPLSPAQVAEDLGLLEEIEEALSAAGHYLVLERYLASEPDGEALPEPEVSRALAESVLELRGLVRQLANRTLKRSG
jgi:ATP-dependent Clp protease ATP-binding subunit ClpA